MTNTQLIISEIEKYKEQFQSENHFFQKDGKLNIDQSSLVKIREIFKIQPNENILYVNFEREFEKGGLFSSDRTWFWTAIFLEDTIGAARIEETEGWLGGSDDKYSIEWKNIEQVDIIKNDDDTEWFRFFIKESNESKDINPYWFGITSEKMKSFCELLNSISKRYIDTEKLIKDKIKNEISNNNIDNALKLIDEFENSVKNREKKKIEINYLKALAFYTKQDYSNAYKQIENSINFYKAIYIREKNEENKEYDLEPITEADIEYKNTEHLLKLKGLILDSLGNHYEAIQIFNFAIENTEKQDIIIQLQQNVSSTYKNLQQNFLNISYDNRKVLLIDNKYIDTSSDKFKVLLKNDLPNIKFPIGHPVEKELYVGHPYNANIYTPLSTYEEDMFLDRFHEFSYFLQSLGAIKLSYKSIKGRDTNLVSKQKGTYNAETTVKMNTVKTDIETTNDMTEISGESKNMERTQIFSPTKKPFLPDDLVWYHHETSWQKLYMQRINGNLLHHHEKISSKQNIYVSSHELSDIKVDFNNLLVKANVNRNVEIDTKYTEKETTEWEIEIEFAPIEELTENTLENKISKTLNSDNEQKYIEEIKDMLSDDGKIDDGEKRLLERKRLKFSISVERAKELEEQLTKKAEFSETELKYIEEVKEAIEDSGEITNDDRRLLYRRLSKLGISQERATELENFVLQGKPKEYTENELKYIEEIKFCLEDDNEISPKERKMLNTEKDDLGISQERADEIEHEFTKQITK